jgi:class 3 adenylate cyclase
MNCPNCQMANPEGARFCLNCGNQLEAQLRVEGERKYVTVLFADVVDSTGLGERLDPEQVAEIMNGAFAFLNASVKKYDGTIARLLGDARVWTSRRPHESTLRRSGGTMGSTSRYVSESTRGSRYSPPWGMRSGRNTRRWAIPRT